MLRPVRMVDLKANRAEPDDEAPGRGDLQAVVEDPHRADQEGRAEVDEGIDHPPCSVERPGRGFSSHRDWTETRGKVNRCRIHTSPYHADQH